MARNFRGAAPARLGTIPSWSHQLPLRPGVHVATIEVADLRSDSHLSTVRRQAEGHTQVVDDQSTHPLQPDSTNQAQGPPVAQPGQRRRQVPSVWRRLDANREQVFSPQVRGDVEPKRTGEPVVTAEQLAVEPDVAGDKRPVKAK